MMIRLAFALLLFASAGTQGAAASDTRGARGESFARDHCAMCHGIGRFGDSPYRRAPAFRTLSKKYNVEGLAEALAEGIIVGNTGERQMPQFVLTVDEIDDLIAYLKCLGGQAQTDARR